MSDTASSASPSTVAAESHRRRTFALSHWDDLPILGGRDAVAGGTWMAVSAEVPDRVAMVTNVRVGPARRAGIRSRGQLPVDYLIGDDDPKVYAHRVLDDAAAYDPVNLLVADRDELWWMTNWPEPRAERVADGETYPELMAANLDALRSGLVCA